MRFIRKGGRIIPIRDKRESADNFEKRLTKIDAVSGVVDGVLSGHFIKRPKLKFKFALASGALGMFTTIQRVKTHGLKKGLYEDFKSSILKMGGTAIGVGAGLYSAKKLAKVRPYSKKAGSDLGEAVGSMRDKVFLKKAKNIDLSKGGSVKVKYKQINKISGLLGYNK